MNGPLPVPDGTPTGVRRIYGETEFFAYRTGIMRYELRAHGGRVRIGRNHNAATYWAVVDGHSILSPTSGRPYRFQSERRACLTALDEFAERGHA